jgi:hypothetical protein
MNENASLSFWFKPTLGGSNGNIIIDSNAGNIAI